MVAIAGLRGTGDWGTDERPKNFREMILWRNPNGNTPITALMSRVGKESTNDPEFSWWDEPLDIIRLRVNDASNLSSSDTLMTVDSVDPTAALPGAVYGLATHLVPGDLLLVEPTSDNATYDHEIVEVDTVISTTSFTIKRGRAGTSAAAINNNQLLLKIGSSFSEGSASPAAASRNPIKFSNFAQIFKTSYELTNTTKVTKARTGDPLKNDKKRRAFDHARDLELALMFGTKSETTGTNGKPLRTMAGIRTFMQSDNTTVFSSAVTISSFLDAVSPVFDFESPGGDERIVLCGNTALNEFNKVIQIDTSTQIQYGGVIKQFGMNLREFILPQGRLFFKTHPLLNRHGLYKSSMWILDFSSFRWRHMPGRDTHFEDNIQGNDEDTTKGQWLTEGGLEIRFGGLTNGYLGNISAT